ncbi:MAG: GNAT family N-acetyltransferase [Cyanobacteria bacterium J06633_8]
MKLHKFHDARRFYTKAKDYLLEEEVLHNLQLGICNKLIINPKISKIPPYLSVVEQDGNIIAVAMMILPYNLLLSRIKNFAAIDIIALDLQQQYESLTNINAPIIESQAFAEKWCLLTNSSYNLKLPLRIFKLETVELFLQAKGNFRIAEQNDKELLQSWHEAFNLEALGRIESNSESWVETVLQTGKAYLWQDEIPVSMACIVRFTPNGAGISRAC